MSDQSSKNSAIKASTLWKIRGKQNWKNVGSGSYLSNGGLWIRYTIEETEKYQPPKIAISVSRKYGNAVKRNKLKRRVKEIYRILGSEQQIPNGISILVGIARSTNSELSYKQINKAISEMMKEISSNVSK